jgi:microcystin-dependent protein
MAVVEYLGAIKLFAGNYAIKGFAFTQGQLMSIQQNTALFALLGTFYGGNGVTNFALPDLQSRLPIGQGTGLGLSNRTIGEIGGADNVTLLSANVQPHTHVFDGANAVNQTSTSTAGPTVVLGPVGASSRDTFYAPAGSPGLVTQALNAAAVGSVGGNLPHNNIQPSMGMNYIMALVGVFPSQG